MILIPEIETVLIHVPRTGSGSIRKAVAAAYPQAMPIYRHMEADGVPAGYDRWYRIGVVRHPVDRLWSLYKFLKNFGGEYEAAYIQSMRSGVDVPFDEWLRTNQVVFTGGHDSASKFRYWPRYAVRHQLPENRKSQFIYLRPDLGTIIYRYTELDALAKRIGVVLPRENATNTDPPPELSFESREYVARAFAWDLAASGHEHLDEVPR